MTFAVLALMSGLLQINPIWNIGPYNPSQVSAGSQPDFYMMWTDGLARTWPAWEIYLFGRYTIPAVFWVAVIMGLVFVVMTIYPGSRRSSPRTTHTTTCCSVRAMFRSAPVSAPWRSRSTSCSPSCASTT